MTNGDYIRSLNNSELSIAIGCIVDEITKLAITNTTYQYTIDEQIKAVQDWLNKQVKHDGKMIKEICKRVGACDRHECRRQGGQMMAENELLPCPFCGSDEAEVEHNAHREFWCYCPICYSRTGTYDQENGYTLAIEAWNRRAKMANKYNAKKIEIVGGDLMKYYDTHYAGDIQPIKLMEAQMSPEEFMGYLRGNIIKYCSRFGKKENADIEDEARKIQKYAEWLHEASKGDKITV